MFNVLSSLYGSAELCQSEIYIFFFSFPVTHISLSDSSAADNRSAIYGRYINDLLKCDVYLMCPFRRRSLVEVKLKI